jgi:hypothetical protein
MDEINDIFEALAGGTAGVVPASVATMPSESPAAVPALSPAAVPGTSLAAASAQSSAAIPGTSPAAVLAQSSAAAGTESSAAVLAQTSAAVLGAGAADLFTPSASSSLLGTVLQSVASPATGSTSSSGGIGSTLETVAMDVLKSGVGLVPIIGGLLGLFGGGDSEPLPTLTKYQMPEAIDYQAAEVGGQLANVDYGQSGAPRAFGGGTGAGTVPGITVNVQAMDARSFLDRSSDIAAAVKDAMLNLNSINDVVNDL